MDKGSLLLKEEVLREDFLELLPGSCIKNLPELITFLEDMSDEAFSLYVSKSHHYFADWILDSYHNIKVSMRARRMRMRVDLISMLKKELVREEKGLGRGVVINIQRIHPPKNKREVLHSLMTLEKGVFGE